MTTKNNISPNATTKEKTKKKDKKKTKSTTDFEAQLIVFNDDFNTFEFVISCLMDICKLNYSTASKATLSIHVNGNETVKTGEYEKLKIMKDQLVDCGLSAVVQKGELN